MEHTTLVPFPDQEKSLHLKTSLQFKLKNNSGHLERKKKSEKIQRIIRIRPPVLAQRVKSRMQFEPSRRIEVNFPQIVHLNCTLNFNSENMCLASNKYVMKK